MTIHGTSKFFRILKQKFLNLSITILSFGSEKRFQSLLRVFGYFAPNEPRWQQSVEKGRFWSGSAFFIASFQKTSDKNCRENGLYKILLQFMALYKKIISLFSNFNGRHLEIFILLVNKLKLDVCKKIPSLYL